MKVLCIKHAEFEEPGEILSWVRLRLHTIDVISPFQGDSIPNPSLYDLIISLGGPQSALQCREIEYLAREVVWLEQSLRSPIPHIGFCLGAQLIGEALGAKAERSPEREVGILPIYKTQAGEADPILRGLPHQMRAIHWHNDMPGVTKDSSVLASSPGCPRQIVRYQDKVYGFQCHFEINEPGLEALIQNCPDDLSSGTFVQSASEIRSHSLTEIHKTLFTLLDRLAH